MANIKSAIKRAKTNDEKRMKNRHSRSTMRTYVKKTETAIAEGNKEEAQNNMKVAISFSDRLAKKSVIHKKKASHLKSRLQKKINTV
ncbi:30S ribosomal protein S20 [bacterium]|nr:30S ribosomal protein S20 [bacterium]